MGKDQIEVHIRCASRECRLGVSGMGGLYVIYVVPTEPTPDQNITAHLYVVLLNSRRFESFNVYEHSEFLEDLRILAGELAAFFEQKQFVIDVRCFPCSQWWTRVLYCDICATVMYSAIADDVRIVIDGRQRVGKTASCESGINIHFKFLKSQNGSGCF